jgi:hypothetical protein|uniref:Uncharacterized protein n=1 Tax=Fagus sylvatica TaxID=28930 RepID=A0A2N9H9P9_FAGSY
MASETTVLTSAPTYALEVEVEVEVPHPLLATIASPRVPLNVGANPTLSASARLQTPVTTSTQARLTLNDFSPGGDGGSPSECDDKYHDNSERVVALSTGWYDNGSRCGKMIRITASNGRSVTAKVVDECDSVNGCDGEHAGQPPCRNNIVDGSSSVWDALGLNKDLGIVGITWSMA